MKYQLNKIISDLKLKEQFSSKETNLLIDKIKEISKENITDLEKVKKIRKLITSELKQFSKQEFAIDKDFVLFISKWLDTWETNYDGMTDKQKELQEGNIDKDVTNVIKEYRGKFTYVKRWMTRDTDVGPCDFCKGLEGKEVSLTENWEHQGYKNLIPGKVHKGCRCYYIEIKRNKK